MRIYSYIITSRLHCIAGAPESFEQKGKFPPSLKPILADVALVAIRCGEYNDNFFSLMPKLFPYNKFTMTVSVATFIPLRPRQVPTDAYDVFPEIDQENGVCGTSQDASGPAG